MLTAALVVIAAVMLGAALAYLPLRGDRGIGLLKTFALAASASVVGLHLLPDAVAALGVVGVLLFLIMLLVPTLIGAFASHDHHAEHVLALELSYWGLVVHSIADGLALGAFGANAERASLDVMIAISAHTVPLIAVVVLVYGTERGSLSGLARAGGLAVATLIGIVVAGLTRVDVGEKLDGVIAAVVGGLLLHAVGHGRGQALPTTPRAKTFDLLVAASGFAVSFWLTHDHGGHDHVAQNQTTHEHGAATGPAMLLELAPTILAALLAALAGAWILRRFLQTRAAQPRLLRHAWALEQAAPDVTVMTLWLLGWKFAVLRLLLAGACWAAAELAGANSAPAQRTRRAALWLEVAGRRGAPVLAGLVLMMILLHEFEPGRDSGSRAVVFVTVSLLSYYSPVAATLVSSALLAKLPVSGVITAAFCAGAFGRAAVESIQSRNAKLAGTALVVCAACAGAATTLGGSFTVQSRLHSLPLPLATAALVTATVWLSAGIWNTGIRAWAWAWSGCSDKLPNHGGDGVHEDPSRRNPLSQGV
jgi:hypothetical protein